MEGPDPVGEEREGVSGELHHLEWTPGSLLEWARALDPPADALLIIARQGDLGWTAYWSRMKLSDLSHAERVLRYEIDLLWRHRNMEREP